MRAALVELLGWSDWEVRVLVLRALQPGRYEDLAEGIVRCLKHRVWQVRLSAAEALGQQRVGVGIGPLIRALEKEDNGRAKTALAEALLELTGVNLGEDGARWRDWWQKRGERFTVPALPPEPTGGLGKSVLKPGTKTVSFYGIPVRSSRIIFVLDRSGSMSARDRTDDASRLDRAKVELLRTVDGLPLGTDANVVFFGSGAEEWRHGLVPLSRTNRRAIKGFLDGIQPLGATDMYEALELALSDSNVEAIFLLSDGAPTGKFRGTREMLAAVAGLNRVRRVRIHCIALGHESALLRELAKQHDGSYERR